MADDTTTNTNALAPGVQTSEGKLTIAAVILGTLLEGLGAFLTHEQAVHQTTVGWSVAVAIAGAMLQLCTIYGYTKSRTLVKQQALISGLQGAMPLAVQVAEAIADRLTGGTPVAVSAGGMVAPKPPVIAPISPK